MLISQQIRKNDLNTMLDKTKEYNIEITLNKIKKISRGHTAEINNILFERFQQKLAAGVACDSIIERTLLIMLNDGLIYSNLKAHFGYDQDYYSIGKYGLIKAVDTYDLNQRTFSTYATRVIYNEILCYIRMRGSKLEGKIGVASLDAPMGELETRENGGGCDLMSVVADEDDFVEEVAEQDLCKYIQSLFVYLSPLEQKVVIYSCGLFNQPILNQVDMSEKLGISQSYVSRIYTRATKKLYEIMKECNSKESEEFLKLIPVYPMVQSELTY